MASGCHKSVATITKPTGESDTRWETCGSKVSRQKAVNGNCKTLTTVHGNQYYHTGLLSFRSSEPRASPTIWRRSLVQDPAGTTINAAGARKARTPTCQAFDLISGSSGTQVHGAVPA